ncbi:MFS transporter [Nonomuraea jabiensis]|uniref:Putative MFS family arabinose efflux permease n=1 Tax=Nonomuraea jabiensis TaxID=882448 RepID=A0A7W9G8X7_9ACTN|nr:MFS transporter [Nonomuraea jabiensis]MBB5779303.1 putative MFS family arabinose efflux permease [Nonomuraea jabiensis]
MRGGVLQARDDVHERLPARLPPVVYVLALGTFLMGTTEFVVAGLLPEIAGDLRVDVAQAGLLITVFALGMIVGAPLMAMLTLRLPKRLTLMLALGVFAAGHVIVALGSSFRLLLAARFLTALATGAFWALAALAAAAIALIARAIPDDGAAPHAGSIRSELAALRSGRLWLVLAACASTTGGVLAAYSYVSPLLTDRGGLPPGLVPLALVGFGIGALAGSIVGGRLGDAQPHAVTVGAAAGATLLLLAICLLTGYTATTVLLVGLLGFFGLGANPVLMSRGRHRHRRADPDPHDRSRPAPPLHNSSHQSALSSPFRRAHPANTRNQAPIASEHTSCAQPSCTAPATSASRTSRTRSSSCPPTRSSVSPPPASAAATCGPTARCPRRRVPPGWGTSSSASSRTPGRR